MKSVKNNELRRRSRMSIDTSKICYGCFIEKSTLGACPRCGFDPSTVRHPPVALPLGTLLNSRYLTGRVLGMGGFGITYLAYDTTLESCVALKEYFPSGLAIRDSDHLSLIVTSYNEQSQFDYGASKFLEESKILAKLRTIPNIVTVYDYFRENGTAYCVMEYIEGLDLCKYAKSKGGRLSFDETLNLLLPIIKSLGQVHASNLLHRDISPDNIIVTKSGTTQLVDFGAARQTVDSEKSKSIILKHGFAPEEQYSKHGNQGPWTDEYALAATIYVLITGIMPPDSIERIYNDSLKSPAQLGIPIPSYANDALMKALSVHAPDRFPSIESFFVAITGGGDSASLTGISETPLSISSKKTNGKLSPVQKDSSGYTLAVRPLQNASPTSNSASSSSEQSTNQNRNTISSPEPEDRKKSIWKRPLTYVILCNILVISIAVCILIVVLNNSNKTVPLSTESVINQAQPTKSETEVLIEYSSDHEFEVALNHGKNPIGAIVHFVAREVHPDSVYGYNIWAGQHLNFVSTYDPHVKAGDNVTVKVTAIETFMGSWIIRYEKI